MQNHWLDRIDYKQRSLVISKPRHTIQYTRPVLPYTAHTRDIFQFSLIRTNAPC